MMQECQNLNVTIILFKFYLISCKLQASVRISLKIMELSDLLCNSYCNSWQYDLVDDHQYLALDKFLSTSVVLVV